MRAIQLEKPLQFRLIDIPEPDEPGPGEAVVRVHRIGICGTDLSGYLGKMPFYSYPRIPGHELGVEVVAVGQGVTNVKPGEHRYHEQFTGQPAIEIDGDIAMVWGEFTLSVDGKVATCGVDHFDLVRENGQWKVQNVTWSQRTTECPGA